MITVSARSHRGIDRETVVDRKSSFIGCAGSGGRRYAMCPKIMDSTANNVRCDNTALAPVGGVSHPAYSKRFTRLTLRRVDRVNGQRDDGDSEKASGATIPNGAARTLHLQRFGCDTLHTDSEPQVARVPLPASRARISSAVRAHPVDSVKRARRADLPGGHRARAYRVSENYRKPAL